MSFMPQTGPLGLLALLAALPALSQEPQGQASSPASATVQLKPKAYRTWEILLPNEKFVDVGSGFQVSHAGGDRFLARSDGEILRADLDGNGECEALVEGKTAFLTFTGKSKAGNAISYSARLQRPDGRPWQYSCGGAMVGNLGNTRLQFLDQNLNGRFDDYGEDAMVVGRDTAASLLSKVVSIDGKLFSIDVAADGSSFHYAPFTGASGELDLTGAFECSAKLQAVIAVTKDRSCSFNLAGGALRVPVGSYTLLCGQVVLGDAHATLATGRAEAIAVEAGQKQSVAWGGPVRAEFAVHRKGDEVGFAPKEIWYYGKLGERFADFMPLGKSPEFTIVDKKTGEVLAVARFPGNC